MSKIQKPLVSVRLMVYNNELYIRKALESVLSQKTSFPVEVVVGDDFSTDRTLEFIKEYSNTDNVSIKILTRNIGDDYWQNRQKFGRLFNFVNIIENCSGTYIALLDGDDYWIDPLKLQKQVDFLNNNIQYSYCGNHTYELRENQLLKNEIGIEELTFDRLIYKNVLNSVSLMFRKDAIVLPDFFVTSQAGDWAIQLIALKKGKAFILKDYMSVYRIHNASIWNSISKEEMCMRGVQLQEKMKSFYSDKKSIRIINKAILERKRSFGLIKPPLTKRILKKLFK